MMTRKETVELLQGTVDDAMRDLDKAPEHEKEWAEIRQRQLQEAMDGVRKVLYGEKHENDNSATV